MKLLESLNDELNNSVQYPKSGAALTSKLAKRQVVLYSVAEFQIQPIKLR